MPDAEDLYNKIVALLESEGVDIERHPMADEHLSTFCSEVVNVHGN